MFCDNCGKNLKEVNNIPSHFMSYSIVPEKVKFFESKIGLKESNKELPKVETDFQSYSKSPDYNVGDSVLKDETTKSAPKTKNDGIIDFLLRPDDVKNLIDRANESIKSNLRAIRLINKILKSTIN